MMDKKHAFIVGAGFSNHAGLPLASQFTKNLLNIEGLKLDGPSALQVEFIKKFVSDIYGHDLDSNGDSWPELEDIFTAVDLAANTGHHLGRSYAPSDLRTVRRTLITRIIRMLQQNYNNNKKIKNKYFDLFFKSIDIDSCSFISMNWDTVIERRIKKAQGIDSFDYGIDIIKSTLRDTENKKPKKLKNSSNKTIQIIKSHGSINWLYCDCCRDLFWFPPEQCFQIAAQIFSSKDWDIVNKYTNKDYKYKTEQKYCPSCQSNSLGNRLATFSYRKALDFPAHLNSWKTAEYVLKKTDTWTFIGYSMPGADYEFKTLLKRAELARISPPKIFLVTGGSSQATSQTISNYKKFFGRNIDLISDQGLSYDAIKSLRSHNILNI